VRVDVRITEVQVRDADYYGWTTSEEDFETWDDHPSSPSAGGPPSEWKWHEAFAVQIYSYMEVKDVEEVCKKGLIDALWWIPPDYKESFDEYPMPELVDGKNGGVSWVMTDRQYKRRRDLRHNQYVRQQITGVIYYCGARSYKSLINAKSSETFDDIAYTATLAAANKIKAEVEEKLAEVTRAIGISDAIPNFEEHRFKHMAIFGPSGTGKSNLLSNLISSDLAKVAKSEASVIVMESHQDLIASIRGLKEFAPGGSLHGKLIEIDASDIEWPVSINPFHSGIDHDTMTPLQQEALHNTAVSMLTYLFRGVFKSELTAKQETLFHYVLSLLLEIPDATLDTMLDVLKPGGLDPYTRYVEYTDDNTQAFFETRFNQKDWAETRSQVGDRLFTLKITSRALARMFSAKKTKLDLYEQMGQGKVILINAAQGVLGEEGAEIYGRFFLASVLVAAQRRMFLPREARLPTYFYVDECQSFVAHDEKLPTILTEARKFNVGITLATAEMEKIDQSILTSIIAGTCTKFASKLGNVHASMLARDMNTTVEFIMNQPKHHFALHVRDADNPKPISVIYPERNLMKMPRMTAEEQAQVRQEMREKYCTYSPISRKRRDPPEVTTAKPPPFFQPLSRGTPPLRTEEDDSPSPKW
jgi:hypothetical protein